MADTILNNYSDDAQIKTYMLEKLAPMVFHNIPLNVLNTGLFSLINEYISQATEQLAFTSSFYFNESFITKAVLPDSVYAEAAIFNIGYAFATPSSTNILLELKLSDIYKNAKQNSDTGLYEFILDKDTKFNLSNGSVYSLDYDILIQYKSVETSDRSAQVPAWNVQYINMEGNSIATNKNAYITYRVTETWLCLFVNVSEYVRETHVVVNNMTNGISNPDTVITCNNHIAGFDIKYINASGESQYLTQDHILPVHSTVNDMGPYIHYIMDNPQTIRFFHQLNGSKYFIPELNSSYEITIYTCHGEAANFTQYDETDQPSVITNANRYSNNGNVMKAAFVIGASLGGTNIGNTETVRRKTIEAYNTANVLSTDHDIEEWLKTFYFQNILYPFFFKRRDDPWGRIWSGYLALKDADDHVFRTNTLHAKIPYATLYANNDNNVNENEFIIPPGWVWVYDGNNRYTVTPFTSGNNTTVETAKTGMSIANKFVFANPFGIRVQKSPFAIGYFNPWINEYITTRRLNQLDIQTDYNDISAIYHATPTFVHIQRTYTDNYYKLSTYIDPSIRKWTDGSALVQYMQKNAIAPTFTDQVWNYFKYPMDMYVSTIPILPRTQSDGYLPFAPERTYLCAVNKLRVDADGEIRWALNDVWIQDNTDPDNPIEIQIPITGSIDMIYGSDDIWGDSGDWEPIYASGDTDISLVGSDDNDFVVFDKVESNAYYTLQIKNNLRVGGQSVLIKSIEISCTNATKTPKTKYGESSLWSINSSYQTSGTSINVAYNYYYADDSSRTGSVTKTYVIYNAEKIYIPYPKDVQPTKLNGLYYFDIPAYGEESDGIEPDTTILYAETHPSPNSNTVIYYRLPLASLKSETAAFYVSTSQLPLEKNRLRVVLHAYLNGAETGRVEMQPVEQESDGVYLFETKMHPTNQLIDVDNHIHIASMEHGGGNWKTTNNAAFVNIDASEPELKISIFVKSEDYLRPSDLELGDSFTGFRLVDEYMIDDFSLVQELKEMRSVVNFDQSSEPTEAQVTLYNNMKHLVDYDVDALNMYNIHKLAYEQMHDCDVLTDQELDTLQKASTRVYNLFNVTYRTPLSNYIPEGIEYVDSILEPYMELFTQLRNWDGSHQVASETASNLTYCYFQNGTAYMDSQYYNEITPVKGAYYIDKRTSISYVYSGVSYVECDLVIWEDVYNQIAQYTTDLDTIFESTNVTGGVEIQQVPFVEYSLMNSTRFESFVSAFTQVHKAIEPVIFKRLEGNHYLDCKLIATYGLPHSYSSDLDYRNPNIFWPDLNVQIEFDVKLYNNAISTNTINELRLIVKSYFNRLTNVHTANDLLSLDNNIYVSHLIQQMESHENVAYMKFKGWYTNEKNLSNGNYMNANYQAIVQKWKRLEDMPTDELERYVPEMFVLDDDNIVINIIGDLV